MARETLTRTAEDGRAQAQPAVVPTETLANGAAAAAILAAGIGSLVFGLIIPLAEAIPALKNSLNWWNPAGPLTGKTTVPVIVWLVAWLVLHSRWKDLDVDFGKIWKMSLVFIAIGFLGSFPLFFELFTAH